MKKTLLICAVALVFVFCGCQKEKVDEVNGNMTVAVLVSEPKSKFTENIETINEVREIINNFEKTECPDEKRKGWQVMITINIGEETEVYSILDNILRIDGKTYNADTEKLKSQIIEIFEKMPEEEEAYPPKGSKVVYDEFLNPGLMTREEAEKNKIWEKYGYTKEEFETFPDSLQDAMLFEPEEIGKSFGVPTREDFARWEAKEKAE